MEKDNPRAAIKILKEAHGEAPTSVRIVRLLSLAYHRSGNDVWALKTLLAHLDKFPKDAQTRTWAAWLLIQSGDLDQAQRLLDQAPDVEPVALAERVELLKVLILSLSSEDEKAETRFEELKNRGERLFPEDRALYRIVASKLHSEVRDPFNVRALAYGGYTTNATQSAPQDTGTDLDASGSPVVGLDLLLRFEPWVSPLFRPVGELRTKGFLPTANDARELGNFNLSGRAGVELGKIDAIRLRALYSYELMGISGRMDDGMFMTAHRGELELDISPRLQFFGGSGRRIYQHMPRTRTELDGGLALIFPFEGGWNFTLIYAMRIQFARNEAFDDRGLTGLVRLKVPLPKDAMIKFRVMLLYDTYPHSEEFFGKNRRDFMLKSEIGPWTPSFRGWRIGLTYGLTYRDSTIDGVVDNFNYTDNRFLLHVRWQGFFNPTGPRQANTPEDHIPLPYGFESKKDSGLERVQDLLREEDSARRGSMCVD